MKVTALLTGRGNNTLKDKNVLPVFGKPLLTYPAQAARNSRHVTDCFVSSDSDKILEAASAVGYEKIKRPEEFSLANSQHIDAVKHALEYMTAIGRRPDIMVVLLANSVTVKTDWINKCIEELINDHTLSAVVPVYREMDHHPFRAKRLSSDGLLEPFFDFSNKEISTNRQDLEPCYFLCHNFWVIRTSNFEKGEGQPPWKFMGHRVKPLEVDEAFDVHTLDDISISEEWLKREGIAPREP